MSSNDDYDNRDLNQRMGKIMGKERTWYTLEWELIDAY
jgi:hypothetical protein